MNWQNRIVSPKNDIPPKVHIRYPCPGLCRLAFMIGFFFVSLGVYYGGMERLGLQRLDWAAPVWTTKHVVLVIAGVLSGMLAGLLAFGFTMTIDVANERLNFFFIALWQFLANYCMLWVLMIGVAMSISLGRERAKLAVLNFGAERAVSHVLATGIIAGLIMGIAFFLFSHIRIPIVGFKVISIVATLCAAKWHYITYGIEGNFWIVVGVVLPLLLFPATLSMIARDLRDRRLVMEQRNNPK